MKVDVNGWLSGVRRVVSPNYFLDQFLGVWLSQEQTDLVCDQAEHLLESVETIRLSLGVKPVIQAVKPSTSNSEAKVGMVAQPAKPAKRSAHAEERAKSKAAAANGDDWKARQNRARAIRDAKGKEPKKAKVDGKNKSGKRR